MSGFELNKRGPDSMQDYYAEKILKLNSHIAELEAALKKYGEHRFFCEIRTFTKKCTCELEGALSKPSEKEGA